MSVYSFKELVIILISLPAPLCWSAGPLMLIVAVFIRNYKYTYWNLLVIGARRDVGVYVSESILVKDTEGMLWYVFLKLY